MRSPHAALHSQSVLCTIYMIHCIHVCKGNRPWASREGAQTVEREEDDFLLSRSTEMLPSKAPPSGSPIADPCK
jgi:hypothetical protein